MEVKLSEIEKENFSEIVFGAVNMMFGVIRMDVSASDDLLRSGLLKVGKNCNSQWDETEKRVIVFVQNKDEHRMFSVIHYSEFSLEKIDNNNFNIKTVDNNLITIPENIPNNYIIFVFKNKYKLIDLDKEIVL